MLMATTLDMVHSRI